MVCKWISEFLSAASRDDVAARSKSLLTFAVFTSLGWSFLETPPPKVSITPSTICSVLRPRKMASVWSLTWSSGQLILPTVSSGVFTSMGCGSQEMMFQDYVPMAGELPTLARVYEEFMVIRSFFWPMFYDWFNVHPVFGGLVIKWGRVPSTGPGMQGSQVEISPLTSKMSHAWAHCVLWPNVVVCFEFTTKKINKICLWYN